MKKGCGNCKFGEKVTDEHKAFSQKVQAIKAKPITNKIKKKEIVDLLVGLAETTLKREEFSLLIGLEDLAYNNLPVEIQGVDIYRICMNDKIKQVLPDFKEGGRNIHKAYFTCEHWEDGND